MKYFIELSARAVGLQLLKLSAEEKDEFLYGRDTEEVFEERYDDLALERQFLSPEVDRFALTIRDENDNIVYETENVKDLEFKTYDDNGDVQVKGWNFEGIADGFYLTKVQTIKGYQCEGEFELEGTFEKDKLYIVHDQNLYDEIIGEELSPIHYIYYQKGEGYEISRDQIYLEDLSDWEEQYVQTALFEIKDNWYTNLLEENKKSNIDGVGIIPEGVTEIAKRAFEDCTSLTSVVIPKGVTKIGRSAFSGCTSLTSAVIPSSVTEIGEYAFYGCTSLINIVIPSSVTEIGENAFNGCSSLTSIVVEEGNSVYDSREECNAIIETATNKLIQGCNSTIIPSSVTEIGFEAFSRCTSLTNIVIPSSVKKRKHAFDGCISLTSIVVDEGNSVYDSREGCNAIIETATNKLIEGCNSTIIPSTVTEIGGAAFYGCISLANIVIPSSVTAIGNNAFNGCESLKSIEISSSVTVIGEGAFQNCSSLTNVVIPEGVTAIGPVAFSGCTSLTSIVIPEGVTKIGSEGSFDMGRVFYGCTSLTSVVINGKIKKIGRLTFENCNALESITLPTGVNKIEWDAFSGCTSIKAINVPAKKKDYYIQRLPKNLHSLIVEMEPVKKAKKK